MESNQRCERGRGTMMGKGGFVNITHSFAIMVQDIYHPHPRLSHSLPFLFHPAEASKEQQEGMMGDGEGNVFKRLKSPLYTVCRT